MRFIDLLQNTTGRLGWEEGLRQLDARVWRITARAGTGRRLSAPAPHSTVRVSAAPSGASGDGLRAFSGWARRRPARWPLRFLSNKIDRGENSSGRLCFSPFRRPSPFEMLSDGTEPLCGLLQIRLLRDSELCFSHKTKPLLKSRKIMVGVFTAVGKGLTPQHRERSRVRPLLPTAL